jgi:adenylyltransferase/sulfurtransferase
MVRVQLPLGLREHAAGHEQLHVRGSTVAAVLSAALHSHPGLRRQLYADDGELRGYVNLYLNEKRVRDLPNGAASAVSDGDELLILPSIAGG